jgi:predicted dehydrogenase
MAEYMTGLEISEVCAEISTFVSGRKLDDDGNMLLRFKGGARGVLMASQISIDEENGLAIRVYGEKGGLEWHQEEPNTLILKWPGKNREVVRAGGNYAGRQTAATQRSTRLPAGHPEGYLEAFANIYREFAEAVRTHGKKSQSMKKPEFSFPSSLEGLRGMAFIEAATKSAKSAKKWTKMPKV